MKNWRVTIIHHSGNVQRNRFMTNEEVTVALALWSQGNWKALIFSRIDF